MSLAERKAALIRMAARTIAIPFDDEVTGCTIWLKLEDLLPSGSTKDRVAAFILGHGVETGAITQETIVCEASSGVMARRLGPGHTIATVLSDRMERYFSTDLFDDVLK